MTAADHPKNRLQELLPAALLNQMRERAPGYDATNTFCDTDLEALRTAGYLAAPVPRSLGGSGLSLTELITTQRKLAAHAPATALAVNMHLVWVQVAHHLMARGDSRLEWLLSEAAAGEVFAFGISEAGNDAVLLDSHTEARPLANGDLSLTGTKTFTTLSPVWTRLGVHAKITHDSAHPSAGQLVFGFLRREDLDEPHLTHPGSWNPLGMRATQSYTTHLSGALLRHESITASFAPFDPTDELVLAIFSSFSLLTAAVYAGIADRALELAEAAAVAPRDRGEAESGVRLDDPEIGARLTRVILAHQQSLNTLALLAGDIDEMRPRDDWFFVLAAARNQVCDEAISSVQESMRLVGGAAYSADSELARLSRDVLAGLYHPSSASALARTVRGMVQARAGSARP